MNKIWKITVIISTIIMTWQTDAQDYVKFGDPWYLFKNYEKIHRANTNHAYYSCAVGTIPGLIGNTPNYVALNPYLLADYTIDSNFRIYGIAIATPDMLPDEGTQPCAVLSNKDLSWLKSDSTYALDTATYGQWLHRCRYVLEYTAPKPEYDTVDCYEYYFNHPWPASVLTDTFFAGAYFTRENDMNYHNSQNNPDSLHFFTIANGVYVPPYPPLMYYQAYRHATSNMWVHAQYWACVFPIVGLRCVAPIAELVDHSGGMATVKWRQSEAGVEYQVAYGPYSIQPDSSTLLTLADTFCTVQEMNADGIQAVWVRKACQYITEGYDTTVWSDWSQPVVFRTEASGIEQVYSDGVKVSVREGVIVVEREGGELPEVTVCDVLGRCLWRRAGGRSQQVAVPAGIYTVRVGDSPARKVTVLR